MNQVVDLRTEARRPRAEIWTALQEIWEDSPDKVEILAALLSRAGRPQFGKVEVQFERGRISYIREEVVHK